MAKKICNDCGHRCHCVGQGYFVSSTQCATCDCNECGCGPIVLTEEVTKKWWQFLFFSPLRPFL